MLHLTFRVLVVLALSVLGITSSAQNDPAICFPAPLVKTSPSRLDVLKKRLDSDTKAIESRPKAQRDYIGSRYKNRYDYFKSSIEEGEFLLEGDIEKYVRSLLDEILNNNRDLNKNVQLYIARNTVPNAYSTGDGNIIFNIRLLNKLDNDAQVTFVLAHELAHEVLQHSRKSLFAKAEKYTDKEFTKALNKTLKEEYNARQKLIDLAMPSAISDMRFSRNEEMEADSLGLLFFLNTKFSPDAGISLVDRLDSIDKYYDRTDLELKKVFSCKDYPYQSSWEPQEHKSSLNIIEDEKTGLDDSLKTHPDCKDRKIALLRQMKNRKPAGSELFETNTQAFRTMKLRAESETIYSMFESSRTGRMIFYAYQSLLDFPDNVYAKTMLSYGFARLNHLQNEHRVNSEFPMPIKDYEKNYNKMLGFLNNLHREDTKMLGYLLMRPGIDQLKKNEDYLFSLTYSAYAAGKTSEFDQLKSEYMVAFPKGDYAEVFKNLK